MKLVLPPSRKPVKRYTGNSILNSENFLNFFFVDAGADYAESADYAGCSLTDVDFAGNVVKVKPLAAGALNDTLGAKDHTEVAALVEGLENCGELFPSKLLGCFCSNGCKYLIGMVMVVIMATTIAVLVVIVMVMVAIMATTIAMLVVIVVMMLVIVASAIAVLVVVVVVMIVIMATTIAMLVVVVVVMIVIVASVVAVLVVTVVMMLMVVATAIAVLVVVVVVMVVIMATAIAVLVVVVVMMVVMVMVLFLKVLDSVLESVAVLHSSENVLAVKAIPGGSDDYSGLVVLTEKSYALGNLLVLCGLCVREDDCRCMLDLVIIELAKVLHIHLALIYVGNGGKAVELCANTCVLHRLDNVGKLADTRWLDNYSVGVVLLKHLNQRLGEIANERAADAAGVHLGNVDACIGKEASVNADFTKLVLDKHEFLTRIRFLNKLLDKGGLTCSEEA